MLELKNNVIVVGPDRCWKTSIIRDLRLFYKNESYKGSRGDDVTIGQMFLEEKKRFYDRGLICDRAYNLLLNRPIFNVTEKEAAEKIVANSDSIYLFCTRQSFEGVKDDVNPHFDLQKLSRHYWDLLSVVPNRVCLLYVDKVKTADITSDPEWVIIVAKALTFLKERDSSIPFARH